MSRLDRIEDWAELARRCHYDAHELAALCRVSIGQLRRFFKAVFGQTPHDWLHQKRLEETARLLRSSLASVKELSQELHFADTSQLCHQFQVEAGKDLYYFIRRDRKPIAAWRLDHRTRIQEVSLSVERSIRELQEARDEYDKRMRSLLSEDDYAQYRQHETSKLARFEYAEFSNYAQKQSFPLDLSYQPALPANGQG